MEGLDPNLIGSQNSLIPQINSKVIFTPPATNSLLRNFVNSNLDVFPLLSRVIRSSDGSHEQLDSNNNNNDEVIYYNTLLHHRIQKGSLLVFHSPTRQVKILARSASSGSCYAIPSTYQGLFKILKKTFKNLEELLAWKDVDQKDDYKEFMAPKLQEVKVTIPDPKYNQLQAGDIIKVKPIPKNPQQQRSTQSLDNETETNLEIPVNETTANNLQSLSDYYKHKEVVELEKFDRTTDEIDDVNVMFDFKATLEEIVNIEIERVHWTVGRLTPLVQKQRLWVKLVEAGSDHPTQEEDLPLGVPLELVQVIAEPSLWVSDQSPDAPVFHLPTRMDIYVKIVKQLQKDCSPLLSRRKMIVSLLDRCVEHLPLPVFHDILRRKYHVDTPLEPNPITNYHAKLSNVQLHSKHPSTRQPRHVSRHPSTNPHPLPKQMYKVSRSPTNARRIATHLYPSRKDSFIKRLVRSASTAEPRLIAFPQKNVYRVAHRSTSKISNKPIYLVSPGTNKQLNTKHPTLTLTPPTPKVNKADYQYWVDYANEVETPPTGYYNEDYIASVVVGKPDDAYDHYSKIGQQNYNSFIGLVSNDKRNEVLDDRYLPGSNRDKTVPLDRSDPRSMVENVTTQATVTTDASCKSVRSQHDRGLIYGGDDDDVFHKAGGGGDDDPIKNTKVHSVEMFKSEPRLTDSLNDQQKSKTGKTMDGGDDDDVGVKQHGSSSGAGGNPQPKTIKANIQTSIPTAIIRPKESDLPSIPTPGNISTPKNTNSKLSEETITNFNQDLSGGFITTPEVNKIRHVTVISTLAPEYDIAPFNHDSEFEDISKNSKIVKRSFSEKQERSGSHFDEEDKQVYVEISLRPPLSSNANDSIKEIEDKVYQSSLNN